MDRLGHGSLSSQMRAAVLYDTGDPLKVIEFDIPPLSEGQVLVRIAFSGVCRSQLMEVRGGRGPDPWLPHLLGHEGAGSVEATGPAVSKVKPGDAVILTWVRGLGADVAGGRFFDGGTRVNAGPVTTFGTHAVVSENRVVPMPEGIPADVAVLFGCALLTGAGIVINELRPTMGSTIAIFGLGGVGLSALMATKLFGSSIVVAIDPSEEKLRIAQLIGATHVVNPRDQDPVEAIRRITSGAGVDYSVEAAGRTETIGQAFRALRKHGGRCIFASHPPRGECIQLDPYDLICGKTLAGSWGGASNPDRDIPVLAELYRASKLPLERLLTKRYTLDQVNDALSDLEEQRAFRPLLVMP